MLNCTLLTILYHIVIWPSVGIYQHPCVQVVEACLATRPNNGGLIDLAALAKLVQVTPALSLCWGLCWWHGLPGGLTAQQAAGLDIGVGFSLSR